MSPDIGSAVTLPEPGGKPHFDRLPAELVRHIIEAAASVDETEEGVDEGAGCDADCRGPPSRRRELLRLSRINRRIGRIAQALLWESLQLDLPANRQLVEGAPAYLTDGVKKLKATVKPPRIDDAAYLSPVHEDFAILARLPRLKTLVVVVESFLGDDSTSGFGLSTIDIDLSAKSPLRRLHDLCIVNGTLNFPTTTDKAPLALKRLALCGYLCSKSSLSTLLSTSVLPHLRSLRLAACEEFDLWAGVGWVDLPDPEPELLDQLDFLQFEDHHGEEPPVGWFTSKAPTLCMADREAKHLDKVRYLYINPQPEEDSSWTAFGPPQPEAVFLPRSMDEFADDTGLRDFCEENNIPLVAAEDGRIEPRTDEEWDEFYKCRDATHDKFDFQEAEWSYRTDFILPAFVKYIQSKEQAS
ncbi:Proteophosphoglycan 5 [Rhodotorula toruloides ATCC 204091]|uniref:Proteophosphoglycan 5 n=1 Tax=Rhodotorula toruloides TaxID=5286 RepID=A0A0K3CDY8_RHOTO|nr:Proteophosphoglycan 5 [Rhodotorula toruloides ATCC 204091]KAK4334546.1 Proteophosphoglycan 5 [Rhodotorula toruloides]PRQ75353.1 Proteophosphoglycan 5 [Rhodotorula toruloides]